MARQAENPIASLASIPLGNMLSGATPQAWSSAATKVLGLASVTPYSTSAAANVSAYFTMIDHAWSSVSGPKSSAVLWRSAGVSPSRASADCSIGTLVSIFISPPKSCQALGGPERITYSRPSPRSW